MTAYRAIGGTPVGRIPQPARRSEHGKMVSPCSRCGVVAERRPGQAWCFDCKQAERAPASKIRAQLLADEARDEEVMTNAIRAIGSERVRRGLAGAA